VWDVTEAGWTLKFKTVLRDYGDHGTCYHLYIGKEGRDEGKNKTKNIFF
jgi:hypothetical protein